MKKLFFSLSLAAISLLTFANHTDKKNSEKKNQSKTQKQIYSYEAKQFIDATYDNVTNLRWSETQDGIIRADFDVFDERKSMFFNRDGNYVATTTEVEIIQLPAKLRYHLLERFNEDKIVSLIYYTSPNKYGYYVKTAEEEGDVVWQINDNGHIQKFKSL